MSTGGRTLQKDKIGDEWSAALMEVRQTKNVRSYKCLAYMLLQLFDNLDKSAQCLF